MKYSSLPYNLDIVDSIIYEIKKHNDLNTHANI